jgi:hypothetical protein
MLSLQVLLQNKDMKNEIVQYLSFESRVLLGKAFHTNYLTFFNFTPSFSSISDMICYTEYDDFGGALHDTIHYYTNILEKEYFEYRKSNFFYENYESIQDNYDSDYEDDESTSVISFGNYSFTDNDKESIHDELQELIENSIFSIYSRKLIEISEEYNVNLEKMEILMFDGYEFEPKLPVDIETKIVSYYKKVFENMEEIDLDLFCDRCGEFGHHNTSTKCMFYDKRVEIKTIRKETQCCLKEIVNTIIEKDEKEKAIQRREPLLCKKCKKNNKHSKCRIYYCYDCCYDEKCVVHYNKRRKQNPKCSNCTNQKSTKCIHYLCKTCCIEENCDYHKKMKNICLRNLQGINKMYLYKLYLCR